MLSVREGGGVGPSEKSQIPKILDPGPGTRISASAVCVRTQAGSSCTAKEEAQEEEVEAEVQNPK